MTETQRDAISPAATGLMIYQTDGTAGFYYYNGSSWEGYYSKNEVDTLIANLQTQITNNAIRVGDFYGGGVVFYIFESGDTGYIAGETHGLIAAVEDQSSGIQWYNGSYVTTGATGTAVGTGADNTTTIISVQGATETSYAAGLARAYTGGGYTDWFLPSKDELNKMYTNRATINTTAAANSGSDFVSDFYWSSTEDGFYDAWLQVFFVDDQFSSLKDDTLNVRAVRAF
jgi:ABC-type Fe3+-hydroxamate transport system substrate-binding protein